MSLAKVSDSGWGDVGLKIINLGKIMCRTWYEVGREDGMKLGMNMAKIFGREFFMAIDDFYDYGYRFFLLSARWLLKGHLSICDQSKDNFWSIKGPKIRSWKIDKQIEDENIFLQVVGEMEGMEW